MFSFCLNSLHYLERSDLGNRHSAIVALLARSLPLGKPGVGWKEGIEAQSPTSQSVRSLICCTHLEFLPPAVVLGMEPSMLGKLSAGELYPQTLCLTFKRHALPAAKPSPCGGWNPNLISPRLLSPVGTLFHSVPIPCLHLPHHFHCSVSVVGSPHPQRPHFLQPIKRRAATTKAGARRIPAAS